MSILYKLLIFLVLVASCKSQKNELSDTKRLTEAVPIIGGFEGSSLAKKDPIPPKIVLLADMPKPRIIEVPAKKGDFYLKKNHVGEQKIELEPPEISPPPIFFSMLKLTTENGLSMDAIHGGTFDKAGNLWVCTDGVGVSKYNGQYFTNYTPLTGIPHGVVWRVLEDRKGDLWFATDGGGLAKYNGIFFTIYTTADGLASNYLRGILEDKAGNLWFSTYGGGVSKYDGKTFKNFTTSEGLANNKVFGMAEDKEGNLWFCTDEGVSKFDGNSFVNYSSVDGLASNHVRSVLADRGGNLWFGTDQWGVSKYNGKDFITYTTKEGLPDNVIWHIMEDKKGNIWFATDVGASEFDGKTFTTYSKSNGLTNNSVRYILEDKIGNIWFLTFGDGIIKYSGKFITNYIMKNFVRSVAEDKTGNLWFSTEGSGVFEYDGKSFRNYTMNQGLADNGLECSYKDSEGNLWFGTQEGGVCKYDGKSFLTYTTEQGLPDNWVWSIREDKKGNFWFSTDKNGVSKFDGKSFANYTTEQGLPSNHIRFSYIDRNQNIWFTTDDSGISKYDGHVFTNYSTAEGLIDNIVWNIIEDVSGNMWVSSMKNGFSRFDGSTFLNYNLEDGIPDNSIVNFGLTKNDELALGTETGLAILTGFVLSSPSDESQDKIISWQNILKNEDLKNYKPIFQIYNVKQGYNIKDINAGQNAMYLDSRDILWIGTGSIGSSLVRLDHSALNKSSDPPNLSIQKLKINNKNIVWSDLHNVENTKKTGTAGMEFPANVTEEVITFGYPLRETKREEMRKNFEHLKFGNLTKFTYVPENLELPHANNSITLDFGAIEPALPGDVLYSYKLDGYNKEWSSPSDDFHTTFGNLFEGSYNLKIKAMSPFGVWSEPISYAFTVLPPWYRTWWALLLFGISSLAFLYSVVLWRTATLRKRQKQLMQTVVDRTDELTNEKKKSDELLLNILPAHVAKELKEKGTAKTQSFDSVTVLVIDFEDFISTAEVLLGDELVQEIDYCYRNFEVIISKYNIEKIKTTGDSFIAVGGLPIPNKTHAKNVVNAALEILTFMEEHENARKEKGRAVFGIRLGVHTGPIIAGVVGSKKFAYDIWGEGVNQAVRLVRNGEHDRVIISETTYNLVKNDFSFIHRGKMAKKDKSEMDMYFVISKL